MRYVHTNIIAKDWRSLSNFYQKVFGCRPVGPQRDLSGEWIEDLTNIKSVHIVGEHLSFPGYNEKWIQPEIDCAAATQNILLAAESIGLGGCWLYFPLQAFYSEDCKKLQSELKIPNGYKPITSIIIGYKADEELNIPKKEIKNISYIK